MCLSSSPRSSLCTLKFGDHCSWDEWSVSFKEGRPCYLNVSFELLIVDVNGVLAAIIRPSPEQTVCHLDVQQVVQHFHLGLEEQKKSLELGTKAREKDPVSFGPENLCR